MSYFHDDTPSYATVAKDQFKIDQKTHNAIQVMIQKIQPVRKLFKDGKLICYSMDGKLSMSKRKYCIFCKDARNCHRKLRLSMIHIHNQNMTPLVFDLNQPSFQNLQDLLAQLDEESLKTTPITMKIVYDENDKRTIEFIP